MTGGRERVDKDEWLLGLAVLTSHRSEDPYVRVGAIVVREDYTVLGLGYNGPPPGIELDELWADRDARRPFIIHAEMNAIRYAQPNDEPWAVFTTHVPCCHCLTVLASYGVSVIKYLYELDDAYDMGRIRDVARVSEIELQCHQEATE